MKEREYTLKVKSDYGEEPLDDFLKWLGYLEDDTLTRWGVEIELEEQ